MAFVLRVCGVPRDEIAKWVLKQADRQRFGDLLRTARGLPAGETVDAREPGNPPE